MSFRVSAALVTLTVTVAVAGTAFAQRGSPAPHPGRDLLAALGTATIDCLGTVGPDRFETSTGYLARTFRSCPGDGEALARIDALLGVQHSEQGHADDLAGYYVSTWNTFVQRFPQGRIRTCPSWTLVNVIDAPTPESVARLTRLGRPGKQNQRYVVSSDDCRSPACAIERAVACAGGFGDGFIVDADRRRGTIEVDPAWWLLDLDAQSKPECEPLPEGGFAYGYCETKMNGPNTLYGAIDQAGERCCVWRDGQLLSINGEFVPIDCGGGWLCVTYCAHPDF